MADLFKSLVKDDVNNNTGLFFEPYEVLNTFGDDLSYDALFKIQIAALQALESQKSYNKVNKFIEEITSSDQTEESESEGAAKIIEYMNRAFLSSENSIRTTGEDLKDSNGNIKYSQKTGRALKQFRTKEEQMQRMEETTELLKQVLNSLSINGSVSAELVDTLQSVVPESGNFDMPAYRSEKAAEIEEVGVDILKKHGYSAIVSGNLYNAGKQLIEDAFAVKNGKKKLTSGGVDLYFNVVKIGGESERVGGFSTFDEFFSLVEKFNGEGRIEIPNELYDVLKAKSDIKMQVKSGSGQDILNAASTGRNAISLQELGFGMDDDSCRALKTYCKYYPFTLKDPQGSSKSLNMVANYHLSKQIALTSLRSNNLYYSVHGFQTASQWMQTAQRMLLFKPAIEQYIESNLNKQNPYSFGKIG